MPRGTVRSALAHRDFRLLLGGLSVSTLGDWLYNVGLQVFVFTSTHSAGWVAASTIFRLLPSVVLGPVGGAIADRFDRRRVMIVCDALRAALMGALALVAFLASGPAIAIGLAFATTLAGTPYRPAVAAMTPSIVSEQDLAAANASIATVNSVAVVAGPALGGLLLAFGSPGLGFAINAGSFLLSALAVSMLRSRATTIRADGGTGLLRQIGAGVGAVRASPGALVVLLFYSCSGFTYGLGTVLFILASEQLLGTGAQGYGYLLGAIGLGSLLAIGFTARLAAAARPALPLTLGLVMTGVPFAALAVASHPAIAFVLLLMMGAGGVAVDVLSVTFLQRVVPPALIGRVFGLAASIGIGVILLGAVIAPLLVAVIGLRAALVAGGLALPLLALLAFPRTRQLARITAARVRELAPRVEVLSRVQIIKLAPYEALESLAESLTEQRITPGETVIRQGDPADDFFVVVSGELEVLHAKRGAKARVVNRLGAGDHFGEIGLIEGIPRTASVVAVTACHLYRISGETLLTALTQAPAMSGPLRDSMAARLARTHPRYLLHTEA